MVCIFVQSQASTTKLARMRNLLDTSQSCVVAVHTDVTDCSKDLSEPSSSNSTLDGKLEVSEARLNEVFDIRTVQNALLRSIKYESTSVRFQCSVYRRPQRVHALRRLNFSPLWIPFLIPFMSQWKHQYRNWRSR